jgi:C1A family cysteine protease
MSDPQSIPKSQLSRATSLTISNQLGGTCFAHTASRILARFIKIFCGDYFDNTVLEKCSYYYKEKCSVKPFDCFNKNLKRYMSYTAQPSHLDVLNFRKSRAQKHFRKYPSCLGSAETRDETGNLKENISAALYSYIYITITNKYGCNGGKTYDIIYEFFENNLRTEISIEDIAFTLNFAKPCNESACFPYIKSSEKTKQEIKTVLKNSYVRLICETIHGALNIIKDKINNKTVDVYATLINAEDNAEEFKTRMERLKRMLNLGYYGEISLKISGVYHAMVIIAYEDVIVNGQIVDTKLLVKNSWGENTITPIMGIRPDKGVYKLSLNNLMGPIRERVAQLMYIVINTNEKSSGAERVGGHKKKIKTRRQRAKYSRKTKKVNCYKKGFLCFATTFL